MPDLAVDVEDAAAGPAHFGVVGVDLDLHFFNRLDRRVGDRAAAQLRDRHAVEQVVVRANAAAAQRHARRVGLILLAVELRVADGIHRRDRDADQERVAPRRGQRLELLAVECAAGRGRRGVDERRLAGHGHRFLNRSDLQHDVERDELLRRDAQPGPVERLVIRQLRFDGVGAGRHRREVVLPDVVGHRVPRDIGGLVDERHRRAGQHAIRVGDDPANAAGECLRAGWNRWKEQQRADKPIRVTSLS